MQTPPCYIVS